MIQIRTVAVLLGALVWMEAVAAQTNLDQARQGLADLQHRIGAFRIQLDWRAPSGERDARDPMPDRIEGVFDGARYQCTVQRPQIPAKFGFCVIPESAFCFDGEKAFSRYAAIDTPTSQVIGLVPFQYSDTLNAQFVMCGIQGVHDERPKFNIYRRPDTTLPPIYSLAFDRRPFTQFLAQPGLKELGSAQIGEFVCRGFETSTDENAKGRVVRRLWLDPANGWFPRRIEESHYTLDDPPKLTDWWTYEVKVIELNGSGVPYAAETLLRWRYGNSPEWERTILCSLFESGIAVTDDMFRMPPPPNAEISDEFAGASYMADEAADTTGLLPVEKIDDGVVLPKQTAAKEQQPFAPPQPLPRQPAREMVPGWPVPFAVAAALALVAGAGLAIAVRRVRRRRPKAD